MKRETLQHPAVLVLRPSPQRTGATEEQQVGTPSVSSLILLNESMGFPDAPELLQTEGAGLLHGRHQLLIQHGEGRVGRQVQPVEAGMSPEGDGETASSTNQQRTQLNQPTDKRKDKSMDELQHQVMLIIGQFLLRLKETETLKSEN